MLNQYNASRFTVEEVAKSLDVSMSLLRFWEEEFDLPKRRNGKMNRLEAAEIRLIHSLIQDKGLTLEDTKTEFSRQRPHLEVRYKVIENLEIIREKLNNLKDKI